MFEFLESKANELIDSINSTANGMSSDSEAATTQATDNESQASQLEAQAVAEEASCPHYKEETRTVTVDDGDGKSHTETETETVPDPAADASSRAKASSLRAQAATLKAAAAALRALASALRAQLDAIKAQRQRFADAIAEVNQKAEDAKQKLNEGTGFIVGAIRAFSVPIVSGAVNMVKNTTNSILENVGIDLSDGFDEKDVYGLTGWIAKTTVDTGAFAVKTFVSTTVASMLGGGMMGTTGAFVVGKVVGPTIDEAFGEKAVDGVHTFLTSALEFLGIKAKPDEKETATAGTEDVNTTLADDKAEIDTTKIGSNDKNTASSTQTVKLTPEQLATEIVAGKWGNGNSRKEALKAAGYTDAEIKSAQSLVNKGTQKQSKSAEEIMKSDNKKGQQKTEYFNQKAQEAVNKYNEYDQKITETDASIIEINKKIKSNEIIYAQLEKDFEEQKMGRDYDAIREKMQNLSAQNSDLKGALVLLNKDMNDYKGKRYDAEQAAKYYGVNVHGGKK